MREDSGIGFVVVNRRDGSHPEGFVHRVERRTGRGTTIVAHTSDAYARQEELSRHAARLMAAGATGDLVLVEEATGTDVARRSLWPETPASSPNGDGGDGQHVLGGWLGDSRSGPRWSPAPLPNQHRFADVETGSHTSNDCRRRDDLA